MPFDFVIMIILMIAVFYFLIIRPQRKRMSQQQEMQQQLAPGTRVLLTSGIFATVVHVGEAQLIVELAPGAEVTVLKGNVARPANPDEEEFEFEDAPAELDNISAPTEITDDDLEQMFSDPVDPGTEEQADQPGDEDPR